MDYACGLIGQCPKCRAGIICRVYQSEICNFAGKKFSAIVSGYPPFITIIFHTSALSRDKSVICSIIHIDAVSHCYIGQLMKAYMFRDRRMHGDQITKE